MLFFIKLTKKVKSAKLIQDFITAIYIISINLATISLIFIVIVLVLIVETTRLETIVSEGDFC